MSESASQPPNEPGVDSDVSPPRGLPDARVAGVAVAVAGIATLALILSPVTWFVLVLGLCIAAAGELYRSARRIGAEPLPLVGFAIVGGMFAVAYQGPDTLLAGMPSVAAAAAGVTLVVVVARGRIPGALAGSASTAAIALTVGILGSFVVALRQVDGGFRVTVAFALMVGLGDIAASLVGRLTGRRPLAPSIGPDKTWEGLAGGTIGVMAAAVIAGVTLEDPITMSRALMLGALVAVVAPLGDLSAAMITRGDERSGRGFFGRGGVLDRIDALLFAAPIFYFAYRAMVR